MMNILSCFKTVPTLDMLADEDWVVQEEAGCLIDTSFVPDDLNPFDESALEMALRLSDQSEALGLPCKLNAVTIGKPNVERYLGKLYALKFHEATRIHSTKDLRFAPEVVAGILSEFILKQNCFDVILMGRQSGEGDNAMTPLLLSEYLSWPCISQVIEISPDTDTSLNVKSEIDGAVLSQKIKTPVVLSIGNSPNSYMRIPTLRNIIQHGKKPVIVHDAEDFDHGCRGAGIKVSAMQKIESFREGFVIKGDTPQEKAKTLYETFLKGKI